MYAICNAHIKWIERELFCAEMIFFLLKPLDYCYCCTIIKVCSKKLIYTLLGGVFMISFFICLALLIGGYFVYGKIVENTFAPDDRETPAVRINDGVDYVVMPQWKLFLVQLLNIAGLGPIFGAMQGALWGPVVFLWITFGTIFAGGVHDYFSGMLSERNNGASISEVCGIYLGNLMKNVMRIFSVVLLVMVGTVFAVGPAGLFVTLFKKWRPIRHSYQHRILALDHSPILFYRNIYFNR